MAKTIIIGGGFSALIAKILLGSQPFQLISKINASSKSIEGKGHANSRRKSLEINKLLRANGVSEGALSINLMHSRLHDRLLHGGNSKIWGGFCNIEFLPTNLLGLLKDSGIFFEPLSFKRTGSISNNSAIGQLLDVNGQIIDAADYLSPQLIPGLLDQYISKVHIINSSTIDLFGNTSKFKVSAHKVILAIGPIHLLDLLYRSGWINDGDIISLSEYEHHFATKFLLDPTKFKSSDATIRYSLSRAIAHAIGYQKNQKYFNLVNISRIYIDQVFKSNSLELFLKLEDGCLNEMHITSDSATKMPTNFGNSIHYCNLKINGISINDFLKLISPNIIGIGMAFIRQTKPGPISSDILLDAKNKLSYYE